MFNTLTIDEDHVIGAHQKTRCNIVLRASVEGNWTSHSKGFFSSSSTSARVCVNDPADAWGESTMHVVRHKVLMTLTEEKPFR